VGRRRLGEVDAPEINTERRERAPGSSQELLLLRLRCLGSRRLLFLPLARQVRDHSHEALEQHQLAAVVHFVLFRG